MNGAIQSQIHQLLSSRAMVAPKKNILWRAISRGGNKQAEEVLFGMAAVNNKFRIRCRGTHLVPTLTLPELSMHIYEPQFGGATP